MSVRFLVTGSTGFIGRRLVARLIADFGPDSLVCLAKGPVTPFEAAALDAHRAQGVHCIVADLMMDALPPPPKVEAVFHLAANIDTNARDAELRINDEGTRRLLDWLRPVLPRTRVMYTSSVAVHDRDRAPSGPLVETSPLVPRTAYGETKLTGERVVQEYAARDGYSWTILRLPTVYGPGQKPGGLFDKLIQYASGGGLLGRVNWPGRTSIIYVDDIAEAAIDLAMNNDAAGQIYCVASDESLTVGDIAARIAGVVGHSRSPIHVPRPLWGVARRIVWNRAIQPLVPSAGQVHFWRLSLLISDGFWFDTAKFRRIYRKPLRTVDSGVAALLGETTTADVAQAGTLTAPARR